MSQEMTLRSLPNSTLEALRCFECKRYLSSSPIRLLPNGQNICGRCSTATVNSKNPTYRLVALEAVLEDRSFPCINQIYECPEVLLFNKTIEHESKCPYKPVPCPTYPTSDCTWNGIASQLFQHFKNAHADYIRDKLGFKLELEQDQEGLFIATENSFPFIVKYDYKTKARILHYDFRFCGCKNEFEMFWNLQLINSSDLDCLISMKSEKCLLYNQTFYSIEDTKILDLNKFQESLDNPDSIVVALKLKLDKSNDVASTNKTRVKIIVNLGAIQKFKCCKCLNYLIPPLFKNGTEVYCSYCNTGIYDVLLKDPNFLKLVNDSIFPCRWEGCRFAGKGTIYKDHVMNCEFRMYCCASKDCKITFKHGGGVNHLKSHLKPNTIYCPDRIIYTTEFVEQFPFVNVLTMKDNRMFVLVHNLDYDLEIPRHYVSLHQAHQDLTKIVGFVSFEHEHCKLKQKQYIVTPKKRLIIRCDQFPPCFKNTVLTVTIELFDQ